MFDELKLLGPTEESIVVQTRKGTPIRNLVELEPGERERRIYREYVRLHGPHWVERKDATGVYNCAGHVWASRRTAILEDEDWRLVFRDDGYRLLAESEAPVAGDLAVYVDENNETFCHVGMIVEMRDGLSPELPKIPWVLSKWNSTSGEVMHYVHDVSYAKQGISAKIEYWTDRPAKRET